MPLVSRSSSRPSGRLSRRFGLTVVEVLAALVIVSVGLLAMAGTSALSLRVSNAAATERQAVARAQSRLALLAAAGCGGAVSGSTDVSRDGVRERWVVSARAGGVAMVGATAEWGNGTRVHRVALRSALLC